ncbi:hypothetical protein, partial [Chryseobacterium ginsenosidimutans]|uniref:hypothetical protein n=1 Tax=Chryseobacterium ginsenosidimutans TaxID=687846 RepID=UPI00286B2AD0
WWFFILFQKKKKNSKQFDRFLKIKKFLKSPRPPPPPPETEIKRKSLNKFYVMTTFSGAFW